MDSSTQATTHQHPIPNKAVIIWLFSCCAIIMAIVIVGAITRLSNSGLSMVEWRPLLGFIPPLNDSEWDRVYDLYKASPEFEKKHFWMNLHDFKQIFFWEWFHRLLGRTIGLVFALPLLWFWITKKIPKGYGKNFIGLFILGGLQGLMGWYMVKSGLVDNPYVSHYRLAAHLSLAFIIISFLLWNALSLLPGFTTKKSVTPQQEKSLLPHSFVVLASLALTIIWGAYTAGLDAGLIYNETFPKMGGHWLPIEVHQYEPFWIAFFKDPAGVQFTHRWLAIITTISVISLWVHARQKHIQHWSNDALALMVFIQVGLGLLTLFSHVLLPVAALHQLGALILLGLLIVNLRRYKPVNNTL